jgi:hypothetical protein
VVRVVLTTNSLTLKRGRTACTPNRVTHLAKPQSIPWMRELSGAVILQFVFSLAF